MPNCHIANMLPTYMIQNSGIRFTGVSTSFCKFCMKISARMQLSGLHITRPFVFLHLEARALETTFEHEGKERSMDFKVIFDKSIGINAFNIETDKGLGSILIYCIE